MGLTRWHGLKRLIFDTVDETTRLVERTHDKVAERTLRYFDVVPEVGEAARAVESVTRAVAKVSYASVRGVSRAVDAVTELPFEAMKEAGKSERAVGEGEGETPLDSGAVGSASWLADSAQAALTGFFGDRLEKRGNALAEAMTVRRDGRVVPLTREGLAAAFAGAGGRLSVFVHGLSCTEWSWALDAQARWGDSRTTYATLLERDAGLSPVFVRYNSGRHISENGRDLDALLEALVSGFPHEVTEIVLIGHSMGGLVVRSAAHHADLRGAAWAKKLTRVVSIGAPHLGAPLEKAVNVLTNVLKRIEAAGAQVPAEVLDLRSSGIKDLRYGYLTDEEWRDRDPDALLEDNRLALPFVDSVRYYFIASTLTRDPEHPLGRLLGDVMVRLPSASGEHHEKTRCIPFHLGSVHGGLSHMALTNHPDVYQALLRVCRGEDG